MHSLAVYWSVLCLS